MGSEGVSAAATGDTAVNGFTGKRTRGASTPTHRTHVCVAWCGPDSVETGVSLLSVQPSGQQILSTLTSTVNATRMRTAAARNSREYIPARVSRTEPDIATRGWARDSRKRATASAATNQGCDRRARKRQVTVTSQFAFAGLTALR